MSNHRVARWAASLTMICAACVCQPTCGALADICPPDPSQAAVSCVMTRALSDRDKLPAARGSLWRFEGPINVPGSSGRINDLAIDPTDSGILYATGATGGLWKTVNGGAQWFPVSGTWPIQSATAVALDPNHPERVFVGTGDNMRIDLVPPFSVGIMRSLDGGLTWDGPFGTKEMQQFTVSQIVVDPNNSNIVLATTGHGGRFPAGEIFRSYDGGSTWGPVKDVAENQLPDANWDDIVSAGGDVFWASATRNYNGDPAGGGGRTPLCFQGRRRTLGAGGHHDSWGVRPE